MFGHGQQVMCNPGADWLKGERSMSGDDLDQTRTFWDIWFHRPLSEYWKAFTSAGFDVEDFEEPRIPEDSFHLPGATKAIENRDRPYSVAFKLRKRRLGPYLRGELVSAILTRWQGAMLGCASAGVFCWLNLRSAGAG
jgi:hypothetical protein